MILTQVSRGGRGGRGGRGRSSIRNFKQTVPVVPARAAAPEITAEVIAVLNVKVKTRDTSTEAGGPTVILAAEQTRVDSDPVAFNAAAALPAVPPPPADPNPIKTILTPAGEATGENIDYYRDVVARARALGINDPFIFEMLVRIAGRSDRAARRIMADGKHDYGAVTSIRSLARFGEATYDAFLQEVDRIAGGAASWPAFVSSIAAPSGSARPEAIKDYLNKLNPFAEGEDPKKLSTYLVAFGSRMKGGPKADDAKIIAAFKVPLDAGCSGAAVDAATFNPAMHAILAAAPGKFAFYYYKPQDTDAASRPGEASVAKLGAIPIFLTKAVLATKFKAHVEGLPEYTGVGSNGFKLFSYYEGCVYHFYDQGDNKMVDILINGQRIATLSAKGGMSVNALSTLTVGQVARGDADEPEAKVTATNIPGGAPFVGPQIMVVKQVLDWAQIYFLAMLWHRFRIKIALITNDNFALLICKCMRLPWVIFMTKDGVEVYCFDYAAIALSAEQKTRIKANIRATWNTAAGEQPGITTLFREIDNIIELFNPKDVGNPFLYLLKSRATKTRTVLRAEFEHLRDLAGAEISDVEVANAKYLELSSFVEYAWSKFNTEFNQALNEYCLGATRISKLVKPFRDAVGNEATRLEKIRQIVDLLKVYVEVPPDRPGTVEDRVGLWMSTLDFVDSANLRVPTTLEIHSHLVAIERAGAAAGATPIADSFLKFAVINYCMTSGGFPNVPYSYYDLARVLVGAAGIPAREPNKLGVADAFIEALQRPDAANMVLAEPPLKKLNDFEKRYLLYRQNTADAIIAGLDLPAAAAAGGGGGGGVGGGVGAMVVGGARRTHKKRRWNQRGGAVDLNWRLPLLCDDELGSNQIIEGYRWASAPAGFSAIEISTAAEINRKVNAGEDDEEDDFYEISPYIDRAPAEVELGPQISLFYEISDYLYSLLNIFLDLNENSSVCGQYSSFLQEISTLRAQRYLNIISGDDSEDEIFTKLGYYMYEERVENPYSAVSFFLLNTSLVDDEGVLSVNIMQYTEIFAPHLPNLISYVRTVHDPPALGPAYNEWGWQREAPLAAEEEDEEEEEEHHVVADGGGGGGGGAAENGNSVESSEEEEEEENLLVEGIGAAENGNSVASSEEDENVEGAQAPPPAPQFDLAHVTQQFLRISNTTEPYLINRYKPWAEGIKTYLNKLPQTEFIKSWKTFFERKIEQWQGILDEEEEEEEEEERRVQMLRATRRGMPVTVSYGARQHTGKRPRGGNRRTLSRLGKRRGTRKNRAESQARKHTDTEAAAARSRRTRRRK